LRSETRDPQSLHHGVDNEHLPRCEPVEVKPESPGDSNEQDDSETWKLTALNERDGGLIQVGSIRELLLRPAPGKARAPDHSAQARERLEIDDGFHVRRQPDPHAPSQATMALSRLNPGSPHAHLTLTGVEPSGRTIPG
jgi:hypothetical protein